MWCRQFLLGFDRCLQGVLLNPLCASICAFFVHNLLFAYWLQAVEKLGCIRAIAISHPHFYSSMVAWGRQFNAPIYVHEVGRKIDLTASCPPEPAAPNPAAAPLRPPAQHAHLCARCGALSSSQQHRSQVCKEAEAGARPPGHNGPPHWIAGFRCTSVQPQAKHNTPAILTEK